MDEHHSLTNGQVLDVTNSNMSMSEVENAIKKFHPNSVLSKLIDEAKLDERSVYEKLKNLRLRLKILNKNRKKNVKIMEEMRSAEFTFKCGEMSNEDSGTDAGPSTAATPPTTSRDRYHATPEELKAENKSLKRKYSEAEKKNDKLVLELAHKFNDVEDSMSAMSLVIENKSAELEEANSKIARLELETDGVGLFTDDVVDMCIDDNEELEKKLKNAKKMNNDEVQNLKKQVRRRDDTIEKLQQRLDAAREFEPKLDAISKQLETREAELERLRKELKNMRKRLSRQKEGNENLRATITEQEDTDVDVEALQWENRRLSEQVRNLEAQLAVMDTDECIETMTDGKYTNEVRRLIMVLHQYGVSYDNVNPAVSAVMEILGKKEVGKLPSKTTQSRLMVEAHSIAQYQVREEMSVGFDVETNVGHTLQTDGTTKSHRKFQNFQVRLTSGKTRTIGLEELGSADAQTTLQSLQELFDNFGKIGRVAGQTSPEDVAPLLGSIKATMTDQAAVNAVFNELLSEWRAEALPGLVANWQTLSEDEREEMKIINLFFCKMHPLATFATECNKVLCALEDMAKAAVKFEEQNVQHKDESGAVKLARMASALLHPNGNQEWGCGGEFETHLEIRENVKRKIVSFRGQRFNVIFVNGGAVYYHREHIKKVLSSASKNRSVGDVEKLLGNKVILAECRALGIIAKLITDPYLRLVDDGNSMADLGPYLEHMVSEMTLLCEDASPLMRQTPIFPQVEVHKDEIYKALFEETNDPEFDDMTQQALEMMMHAFLTVSERQFENHLEGGKYYDADEKMLELMSRVPRTNRDGERDFAILDHLMRLKPSANLYHLSAMIMWMNNGTHEWLNSKSGEEMNEIMDSARKDMPAAYAKYVERRKRVKLEKLAHMDKRKKEYETKEHNRFVKKTKATANLFETSSTGLWTDVAAMEDHLSRLDKDKDRCTAVLAQLRFHQYVLGGHGAPAKLFYASKSGVKFGIGQLKANITELLENHVPRGTGNGADEDKNDEDDVADGSGERVWDELGSEIRKKKEAMMSAILDERDKRKALAKKEKIKEILANPGLLVGKKISLKMAEDMDWCNGFVLEVHDRNPEDSVLYTNYTLTLDNTGDETFTFPLLSDLNDGNLLIL